MKNPPKSTSTKMSSSTRTPSPQKRSTTSKGSPRQSSPVAAFVRSPPNSIDEAINSVVQKSNSNLRASHVASKSKPSSAMATTKSHPNSLSKLVVATKSRICGLCHKSDQGGRDELITCSVCGLSGHSKCLGCSEGLLKRIKEFPNWECPNCKKCPLCGIHDEDTNLICIKCDRGFHRRCLNITLSYSGECLCHIIYPFLFQLLAHQILVSTF